MTNTDPNFKKTEISQQNNSVLTKILELVGPLIALIFVFCLFAILDQLFGSQQFLSITNLRTILIQTAVVAVAALGMTLIIISGGIDLSAGTALALCATVLAWGLNEDVAFLIAHGTNFETASKQLEKSQKLLRRVQDAPQANEGQLQLVTKYYQSDKKQLLKLVDEKIKLASTFAESDSKEEILKNLNLKRDFLTDPDHVFFANTQWLQSVPNSPWSPWIAISLAVLTGMLTGLLNGLLITSLRVVPFIVTLGTMTIYSGFGLYLANNTPIRPDDKMQVPDTLYKFISNSQAALYFGLPLGVWLLIVMIIIVMSLLHFSVLSRHLFAIGSNEATARLCGISIEKTKIIVYVISGLFIGIAGIYLFSRLSSGNPNGGAGKELEIIAAVVIGGGSLSGGRGSILGTLAGALIVGVISAGSTLLEWELSIYNIILGCVIISAVFVDQVRKRLHEK